MKTLPLFDALNQITSHRKNQKDPLEWLREDIDCVFVVSDTILSVPRSYWRRTSSRSLSLYNLLDSVTIRLTEVSVPLAGDFRKLAEWVSQGNPEPLPGPLKVLKHWLKNQISTAKKLGEPLNPGNTVADLSATLWTQLESDFNILVTQSSFDRAIAKLSAPSLAGRPGVPGLDRVWEALIKHIIGNERLPSKDKIRDIMYDEYVSIPDKERKDDTGKERMNDNWFDSRAKILDVLFRSSQG